MSSEERSPNSWVNSMSSIPELQQKIADSYLRVQKQFDFRVAIREGVKGALVGALLGLIAKEVVKTPSTGRFTLCTIAPALAWGVRGLLKSHEWAHQELNHAFLCAEASKDREEIYRGLDQSTVKAKDSFLDALSQRHFERCCVDPDELEVRIAQLGLGFDSLFGRCVNQGLVKDNELSRRLFTRWANRQIDKTDWNRPIPQEKMNELLKEVGLSIREGVQLADDQRSIIVVAALLEFTTPTGLNDDKISRVQPVIRALFISKLNQVRPSLI